MALLQTELVTGIVTSRTDLDRLISSLETRGFTKDDICLVTSERNRDHFLNDTETVEKGAGVGALGGGLLGALLGAVAVLPGGPIIAGTLLGLLTGGTLGATAGGLFNALKHAGVPDSHVARYTEALNEKGHILVMVKVPEGQHVSEVRNIFEHYNLRQIHVNG